MAAVRTASVIWEGSLAEGAGTITGVSSGALQSLPVTWASRAEPEHGGRTSPEELLAAAHATCFSMSFSGRLARAGHPPARLETSAAVTFDRVDGVSAVVSSALTVRAWVPGISQEAFTEAAESAKEGCPISKALAGNVQITLDATLEA